MGRRGEGLLRGGGPRLRLPRAGPGDGRPDPQPRRPDGRLPVARGGPGGRRELRLPLDRRGRRVRRPRQALPGRLLGGAGGDLRAGRLAGAEPRAAGGGPDLGRLSVREPLLHDPGARTVPPRRPAPALLQRRHALPPHGAPHRGPVAGGRPVQRPVLLRRAARLPEDHRHHVHDHDDDPRPAGPRGPQAVLPGAAARAARHRRPARSLHALLPERVPGPLPSPHGHPPLGPRRAPGVRALHEGGLRPDGPVDRRAGHLRRGQHGLVRVRAVDRGPRRR